MISIVYVSNRGAHSMLNPPWSEMSQYALLEQSISAQTFQDFELIVVDAKNTFPRPELKLLAQQVTYLRPRETPWSTMGAFAPASARNTGMSAAKGDLVFGLDDCSSFKPDLLQHASDAWQSGRCFVPRYVSESGSAVCIHSGVRRGGVLCYPRQLALSAGGYEERFDGSPALEDWEFTERLARLGAVWHDATDAVTLHAHTPHSGKPANIDGPHGYHKCPYAVFHLVTGQDRANRPWTREQLAVFEADKCQLMQHENCIAQSGVYRKAPTKQVYNCAWPARPSAEALHIMQTHESQAWIGDGNG